MTFMRGTENSTQENSTQENSTQKTQHIVKSRKLNTRNSTQKTQHKISTHLNIIS